MRIVTNSILPLTALLVSAVFMPCRGWAATGPTSKNCPTEPAQDVRIVSGETYYGTNCVLASLGDVDSFQFNGSVGDIYSIVAGLGASAPANVCMALYPPGSTSSLFSGCTCAGCYPSSSYAVGTTQTLTAAGLYTIVVSEASTASLPYGLSLERLYPTPPEAIPLSLGDTVTGNVNPPTAQDSFTFDGVTTGTYEVTASYVSNSNVCMNIYQPDGSSIASGCTCVGCYPASSSSVQKDITPTQDGTYMVLISAAGNDATSGYSLDTSCLLGKCTKTKAQCVLDDALSYDSTTDTLTMNFTIGTPYAATWNGWLTYGNTMVPLWSQGQAITEPPVAMTMTHNNLAKSGVIGVLSTLTTAPDGIRCSSWEHLNTGN